MLRTGYDEKADLWSVACTVFELVTGDFLFYPKKGKHYCKNEDHLAKMAEMIGECKDFKFLKSGKHSEVSFTPLLILIEIPYQRRKV